MSVAKNQAPFSFIVVGSGQVVEKYWCPAMVAGLIDIKSIITLAPADTVYDHNPRFQGDVVSISEKSEVEDAIFRSLQLYPEAHIALVIPATDRLALTRALLNRHQELRDSILFLEKPFARTCEEIAEYEELIRNFSANLHFSGKYTNGRADILYPHLPEHRVPQHITANLLEGSTYFNPVQSAVELTGRHTYLDDGPELDLGFHLLDIITTAATRFGGVKDVVTESAADLASQDEAFLPGYAFTAQLRLFTNEDAQVEIQLKAGKYDGEDNRTLTFEYPDRVVTQLYTNGTANDPVFSFAKNLSLKQVAPVDQHPPGYHYYSAELQPGRFGRQTAEQQRHSLLCNALAIELKQARLSHSCYATPHALSDR